MGRRNADGKRIKWTRAEKKMVREMREAGMMPGRPVLDLRSRAERLGKQPMEHSSRQDSAYPPHLRRGQRRTMRIRSVIVVPQASDEGPSELPTATTPMQICTAPDGFDIPPNTANTSISDGVSFDEMCEEGATRGAEMKTREDIEVPKNAEEEEDMSLDNDNASYVHDGALVKYVPDDETFDDSFITDQWEGWMPEFFPLYEGPTLPLSDLPMNVIFGVQNRLPVKDRARFLTAIGPIARRPEAKRMLFQAKRVYRQLFRLMGEWNYYLRWVQPKELARGISDRDERIACAYRHYCKYGKNTRFEQMSINDIAHLWGVFGTELREEIDWQEGGDNDSSDDDIMQQ